jgi:hypothetical protein
MRRARGVAAAWAVAAATLLATAARADDDFERGSARREVETAVKSGDEAKALAYLDGLLRDGTPRIRARHVEAAHAAWDLLPKSDAAPRAAQLLAEALRLDASDRDGAWKLAQAVRTDLVRRVDVDTGLRFLSKLAEIYPSVPYYRHDAALLALDGSRRAEARQHLEANLHLAPADSWAADRLAILLEEDEQPLAASEVYDRLIAARPGEVTAHLSKAKVLGGFDRPKARAAIAAGEAAAAAHPDPAERAYWAQRLAEERFRLDAADRRVETIGAMRSRVKWAAGIALALWLVAAAGLVRATRAPHASRN